LTDSVATDLIRRRVYLCYYPSNTGWTMHKAIEGIFRDGKVELLEPPPQIGESRVLVTFLPAPSRIDLAARGIDKAEAAELRGRLSAFAEDWDRPEMDIYDEE
jgi:hypothetical protein